MSVQDFFDHECNVFHLVEGPETQNYGLDSQRVKKYDDNPAIEGEACHFNVNGESVGYQQGDPQKISNVETKLSFNIGVDIRYNDKIVWPKHNIVFTVTQPPRQIRDSHMVARLYMEEINQDL